MQRDFIHMETCTLCNGKFRFGRGIYDGRRVAKWSISVCRTCEIANQDGVVPSDRLVEHLNAQGVEVTYNDRGWIDLPARSS